MSCQQNLKGRHLVIFKNKGYPSGIVKIDDKIHLVSTPLKGVDHNGYPLFLEKPPENEITIRVSPSIVGIIGQELAFAESTQALLLKLFDTAPSELNRAHRLLSILRKWWQR